MRLRTPWIFHLFAGLYDGLTAEEPWRRHCREMARLVPGRRVLDLGIGPGVSGIEMARAAPGDRFFGLDSSTSMLRRTQRHATEVGVTLDLVRADASQLPFAGDTYDGVTGHSFLYLLDDAETVLREVHRVLRPGGRVAFLEPGTLPVARRAAAVLQAYQQCVRFGTAMLLWTVFSLLHGRYTPETLAEQLVRCGFLETSVVPAFGGLGLVITAMRPECATSPARPAPIGIPRSSSARRERVPASSSAHA